MSEPQTLEQRMMHYLALVGVVNGLVELDVEWETKFDLVFKCAREIRELNLKELDYYDPDTSYEEDVRAYVAALNNQAPEIGKALGLIRLTAALTASQEH